MKIRSLYTLEIYHEISKIKNTLPSHKLIKQQIISENTYVHAHQLYTGNTSSRQKLHKMFPETPTNSDALETQQRALLEAQEREGRGGGKSNFAKNIQK